MKTPKTDKQTITLIKNAIEKATQEGVAKWGGKRPALVPNPVHDGDGTRPSDGEPFGPECKGMWVFTASCKESRPPFVVDSNRSPIIDSTQIYSGMWGRVCVNFYPYNFNGKKGVGAGLNGFMKMKFSNGQKFALLKTNSPQKVFSKTELTAYLKDALGEDFVISNTPKGIGNTAVVLTKKGSSDNSTTRYSLRSADKNGKFNTKRNSSVSMPTSHKGQDVTANRGIDNKITFTDKEVNSFKNKLNKISVSLSAAEFLDALKKAFVSNSKFSNGQKFALLKTQTVRKKLFR